MNKIYISSISILIILLALISLTGCSGETNTPEEAVVDYLQALVSSDQNGMINNACSSWESQAKLEYESFAAVETILEDVNCQTSSQVDDTATVDCTGRLVASYGEEDLVIELENRTYVLENEGGQWRVCGYQ